MKRPRVLITGAAGFLGSHLCDLFINEGYDVIGLDNLITGSASNIAHLRGLKAFSFCNYDVTKRFRISGPLDYILHFASPASPKDFLKMPIDTLRASSLGTFNCLELARIKNSKILIASTSEIYGDPLLHPQKENYWGNVNPIGPRSVYNEAKRFQESVTVAYKDFYGVEIRIARIFNTYGPRMRCDDGRVVSNFICNAIKNINLEINGNGLQTRSFCFYSDLVAGIFKLIHSKITTPVNLGSTEEVSIYELASEIISLSKSNSKIIFKSSLIDDPSVRKPSIELANSQLQWSPLVSRREGLLSCIEHYKSYF